MSAIASMSEALLITYTLFPDVTPSTKTERADVPWEVLVENIRKAPTYLNKASCPLISIGEYGDLKTDRDCLRHAANVRRVFGIEIDYDSEQMPIEQAAALLDRSHLCSVLYTSPSHTPEKPRWRALLPLSEPAIPEKRREYVGRVNRVLGGVATRESFTLSQSFYLGRVRGAEYVVVETFGRYIDMAAELDPQYYVGGVNDGESPRDATTDAQLREAFVRGEGRYQAMLKLSSRWAARGLGQDDIEAALSGLLDIGSSALNGDGIDLRTRVRPMAQSAVRKFGESRAPAIEVRHEPDSPAKKPEAPGLDIPSLAQIMGMTTDGREWFFEEILPAGAFLIVGRPKVGKSWLLFQLALDAAMCRKFLDYEALGEFGVLYFAAEDDYARIQSRFRNFRIDAPPTNLHIVVREQLEGMAKIYSENFTLGEFLDAYLKSHPRIKFVFIDTEATCRHVWEGANGGSAEQSITRKDYAEVREFDSIALKYSCFIGLVNHTSKRRNGTWFDIHELINRTNTALAGASGSIVIADPPGHDPMDSESRVRVLGIRGRDINGEHLIAIEQRQTGEFVSLGKWTGYVQSESETEICDALIEINSDSPGQWIKAKEVGAWINKSGGSVSKAISRMISAGRIRYKDYRIETKKSQGIKLHKIEN